MSGRDRVWLLSCISLLASLACGGVSVRDRDDASGTGGSGGRNPGGPVSTGGTFSSPGGGPSTGGSGISTGGSTGVGGSFGTAGKASMGGMPPIDGCPFVPVVSAGSLTDFDGSSPTFDGGGYYIYQDLEHGGTTLPDATVQELLSPVPGGYSGNALHFEGDGFSPLSWGAGLGVWLNGCVDASTTDGLSFFMRSTVALDVGVSTRGTQSVLLGGGCSVEPCIPNHARIPAAADWVLVEIAWSEFSGGAAPFDAAEVIGVNFAVVPPVGSGEWGFQVWVDELYWGVAGAGSGGQPNNGSGGYAGSF